MLKRAISSPSPVSISGIFKGRQRVEGITIPSLKTSRAFTPLLSSIPKFPVPATIFRPRIHPLQVLHGRPLSTNGSHSPPVEPSVLPPPSVGRWLLLSSTLVFAVIVVGGVTRLTESGLSITEWRPITGILPPLSSAEWEVELKKYRATPEFKL
jgi:cytochrome c oxidase assembly protein subunit 15